MKRCLRAWWHWFVQGIKAWLCVGLAFAATALFAGAISKSLMWTLEKLAENGFDMLWLSNGVEWLTVLLLISFFGAALYHCFESFPLRNYKPKVEEEEPKPAPEKSDTE